MPKRRLFQIHLSTAVVLMFVAGVLVWANVRERKVSFNEERTERQRRWKGQEILFYGWPCVAGFPEELTLLPNPWMNYDSWTFKSSGHLFGTVLLKRYVLYDALIALAILVSVCVACEWRIRRRAKIRNA